MKFARRAALLTTIAQVAVVLPELTQLPGYFSSREAIRQTNDELERAPGRSGELNALYLRNLKDQLVREETRLQKAIEAGRAATSPDGRTISELEEELTALRAQYPALFETKPN